MLGRALRSGDAAARACLVKKLASPKPDTGAKPMFGKLTKPMWQQQLPHKTSTVRATPLRTQVATTPGAPPATAEAAGAGAHGAASSSSFATLARRNGRRGLISRLAEPLRPRMLSVARAMTRERVVCLRSPIGEVPQAQLLSFKTNWSNLCGHGSFLMLALGYMESDVLLLRVFSAGGIVLSVLFQYYRPQPLWIPISWNTIFLLINGGMIALLVNERRQATRLDSTEERELFDQMFAKLGLSAVEFLHLIRLAERETLPAGTTLATFNEPQDKVYLIIDGTAEVQGGDGDLIGHISKHMFVGSMAFLRFLNEVQEHERDRDRERQVVSSLLAALANELDPEHWEIEPDGTVVTVRASSPTSSSGSAQQAAAAAVSKEAAETVAMVANQEGEEEREQEDDCCELCSSSTSVRATTECHVYAWDFHLLRAYLKRHPLEGNAMQVTISADLTRKLDQSRDPHIRYRQLLLTALSGGELLPTEKRKLQRFRENHDITLAEHDAMLAQLGWTKPDYETGYQQKAITASFAAYERMLQQELRGGTLNEDGRARLRRYRSQSNINPQQHLLAIAKLGWTYEQYEMGQNDNANANASNGGAGTAGHNVSSLVTQARMLSRKLSNQNPGAMPAVAAAAASMAQQQQAHQQQQQQQQRRVNATISVPLPGRSGSTATLGQRS
eukprot:TRINITY_DN356_c4_g1_i1.p1 TRINITY_DN356_c4_g1~~TRINITY_DN356_c4_g1_i1.p1  ORF type:complete len:674 (-),score=214.42 TRINITY_DN356_c4_g1_i1:718-2739(-)